MKDERKKCRVVSCEIFEKKEKNLKTHECVCVFFWLCKCVKKLAKTLTSVQNGACPYKKFFSPKYENKNNKIRG